MSTKSKKCPSCQSVRVVKRGIQDGIQVFWCKDCNRRFRSKRRYQEILTEKLWYDYVFHKQTIRELGATYSLDTKTVIKYVQSHSEKEKEHIPRSVHLVVDGTYFGERKEDTTWCVIVFRDAETKENVWFDFFSHETTTAYLEGRTFLEEKGYIILSVTGDGFSGIRTVFAGIPFQMCHVHMERIVVRGTTRNPKLLAAQVLLALVRTLHDPLMTESLFRQRLIQYKDTYWIFLNEKTVSSTTGESWYVHEELRRSFFSVMNLFPYLFTYKSNPRIPRTTNSLEGHFRHVKDILSIHCGTTRLTAQKILTSILSASTIAPETKQKKS